MGALNRATVLEVEELIAGDPEWWPGLCGVIAEEGQAGLKRVREERGWSWGALWGWIVRDERRYGEYMRALEAYVQDRALETVAIADGSEDAKLRVDTRFKLAGKVDRERWGEQKRAEAQSVVLVDAGLIGFAAELLSRAQKPAERTVEALPEPADGEI